MSVQALRTAGDVATRPEPVAATGALSAERWDRFVEAVPGGDVRQTAAWAGVKRASGAQTCQIVVEDGGDIVGGAEMVIRRFGPLGAVGYIARGPLVATRGPEAAARVLDGIERAARTYGVRLLIVQPPEGADDVDAALQGRGYSPDSPGLAPDATLRIDLSRSLDRILCEMSASRRRHVRRSVADVRMGERPEVAVFYALHEASGRRQGFRPDSLASLHDEWDALRPRGWVQLILAYGQGQPLAGIWLWAFGDSVTYRLPGWDGRHGDLYPNEACHWRAIQWAKEQGYRYYDLGGFDRRYTELTARGESLPEDFLRSFGAFKRRFGGEPVLLPTARLLTFHPIARPLVRLAASYIKRSEGARRLLKRMRALRSPRRSA